MAIKHATWFPWNAHTKKERKTQVINQALLAERVASNVGRSHYPLMEIDPCLVDNSISTYPIDNDLGAS